jgi:hypothetical protein
MLLMGTISYPSGTVVKEKAFNLFPYFMKNITPFVHSMIFQSQLSLSLNI